MKARKEVRRNRPRRDHDDLTSRKEFTRSPTQTQRYTLFKCEEERNAFSGKAHELFKDEDLYSKCSILNSVKGLLVT